MANQKKLGMQSIKFENPPVLTAWATIVGPKEGEGPWGSYFDWILEDYEFGEQTWEKAESKLLRETVKLALSKKNYQPQDIELMVSGDLLNQITSSNYAARELQIPFLGMYGACSTMAESLLTAAMAIDGGYFERAVAAVSSHHYTAERQFRFPTEQGTQRSMTGQWTVTGAGAVVLEKGVYGGPRVTCATIGKIIDLGQKDVNDMGSAMAPAAADTIKQHLDDTNRPSDYYDLIVTGDLGKVGSALIKQLFVKHGIVPEPNYSDCGVLIFNETQDVHAGGSGCGCSAAMLCGPLLKKMEEGKIKRLLLVATGALMSPTTSFQGESIPGIAHAVALEYL
ncbi:MAG TPA: stage V sporulation protein AD [Syntrophomonadaceae bacterium]|nr:stage V sporulation protein AD [Syntrophomonadaceae bacterium]HPU48918.1 stage V sporulation protein AD [Syntrophomonadaceae bacterium]